ncbi:hypothetical protein S40293_06609 [Stachybotrys chartarum IBT 40293]|nr:hypothetical protein S40293_06609 [Stachybotrys chartarum IBT 40293]
MLFTSIVAAALLGVAQAQTGVDVQVVAVGQNPINNQTGLAFYPDKITATPGSMVQFQFWAGNHTVTQSTFDQPCLPMPQSANITSVPIWSGYQPVAASEAMGQIPVFTVMINDTRPIWLYCSQGQHCQNGMVMVINENTAANASRSLENYKSLASTATGENGGTGAGNGNGNGNGGSQTTPGAPGSSLPAAAPITLAGSSSILLAIGAAFLLL